MVLEKDEIKAAAGDRGKVVHLTEFVDAAEIDPVFFEKTYYVGSRDDADPYRLVLRGAAQDRARRHRPLHLPRPRVPGGPARARRRARDCTRCASTTRSWPPTSSTSAPAVEEAVQAEVADGEQAGRHALAEDFDPEAYEDSYREAVLDLIKRKGKGEEIDLDEQEEPEQGDDLMAALEASLAGSS